MVMLTDEALAELAKIENKIGDYICRLCCQKFENAFSLALHKCSKIVHVVHRCPECAKVFNCPANLASHRRWHKPRSSGSSDMKETIGKEEGEICEDDDDDDDNDDDDDDGAFIEGEANASQQSTINSPISNGCVSPSFESLPPKYQQSQQQKSQLSPHRSRPPPQSPPPLKRTKVCVTGTVKIDLQEPTKLSTSIPSPIPLISKSSNKLPLIKSPIKSPIKSTYKPSPLYSLSSPASIKIPQPSHSPTILSRYSMIANNLLNSKSDEQPTDSDLPLALTSPTSPTSTISSVPSGPILSSSSSSSSSSSPPPQKHKLPIKSQPIMATMGSSSSTTSSSSPSPPPTIPPSSTQQQQQHQINTPTTPPPTPPPHNQQNQQSSSNSTIIGEMTTMTKESLFGWTYYPKKFRRQAYMRIKHCCP